MSDMFKYRLPHGCGSERNLLSRARQQAVIGLILAAPLVFAQEAIEPVPPSAPVFWRPYLAPSVPPISLADSSRLASLIRGGKLYLTAQDAIALALENNIDIAIARYTPFDLAWRAERAEAGGALPGVPTGASQTASIASGQGVLGSQAAAGIKLGGAGSGLGSTANATVAQVGPVTANLDPSLQESTTFIHKTVQQPDVVQSITPILVQGQRVYSGSYQQGFLTGGSVNITYNEHYLNENSPTDFLNPSVAPTLSFSIQHNLLQGLGIAVNARSITVAKMNLRVSDLNFRTQVEGTVVNVLYAYDALVADFDDLKAKQDALDTARRFLEESRQRLALGALAELDIATARNQVAVSELALVNSEAAVGQQQIRLRNLISRTGAADPAIADIQIVPVDQLTIPATDDLPPIRDLVRKALAGRADLLAEQANVKAAEVSALGTTNGLLPSAQAFAVKSNAGTAGTPHVVEGLAANPYFAGGMGNALGQVFRNNFPSQSVGAFGQIQIYDRQAQADYAIDQLQIRQQQLGAARDLNQAQVDVTNAVVAVRQSRARYDAAVQNRILQEQLLDAEQKKFTLGASTSYNVTQQQRDLAAARAAELGALVAYRSARINLDQSTGATLEANRISLGEAQTGKVARISTPQNPN
jgi:outer membrane protein TolC